ncbi:MAG: hypothetical protein ABWX92_15680 [Mycetocola sp.]
MTDRARLRNVASAVLGAIVLMQLLGCAPEPVPGDSAQPTPDVSATPSESAPAPSPTQIPTATPTATVDPPPDGGSADVVIITADVQSDGLEVTGIVTGQTDPDGVCVLAVSQDEITRTAEATVTTTNGNSYCPLMVVPRGDLSAGAWQVVLSYRASGVTGVSSPVTVELP